MSCLLPGPETVGRQSRDHHKPVTLTPLPPQRERAAAALAPTPLAATTPACRNGRHSPAPPILGAAQDGASEPLSGSNLPADLGEHPTDLDPRTGYRRVGEGPSTGHPCLDTEAMALERDGDVHPRDRGGLAGPANERTGYHGQLLSVVGL